MLDYKINPRMIDCQVGCSFIENSCLVAELGSLVQI